MCGIFGYVGGTRNASEAVLNGLKMLDYRGYDSWGIGALIGSKIMAIKHIGIITANKPDLGKSAVAIGHTRWATNGAVTVNNAHPHFSTDKTFLLAHNGIMENFDTVKKYLQAKGFKFVTQTDTEVIVRLIENEFKKVKNLTEATRLAFNKCEGRNTIILLSSDGKIIAARNGSPLVLGFTDPNSEMYFSSDTLSFSEFVKKSITVKNGEMVTYNNHQLSLLK